MAEETFNLYGIKITCFGDVERARTLAPHARRLMPQIKELGLPTHMITSPDGSYVQVLHQAGMDFARIYVPPMKAFEKPKPKVKEEFSQLYHPAWFAYNDSHEHVGYIVALGTGWQGPYEFIPREAEEMRDDFESPLDGKIPSFEMGQWTEWWGHGFWNGDDSRPFEWDDFLTPKLLYLYGYENPHTEKMFWDIAPSGARNRFFKSALSNYDGPQVTVNSWLDYKIFGYGAYYTWVVSGETNMENNLEFKLTLGDAGEQAGFEDDIVGTWEYGYLLPLENQLEGSLSGFDQEYFGSRSHALANECFINDDDFIDAYDEVAESVVVYENANGINCKDWGFFERYYKYSGTATVMEFESAYSSAEDANHYGLCYTLETQTSNQILSNTCTEAELMNARFEVSRAKALYISYPQPIELYEDHWEYYYRGSAWDGPLDNGTYPSTPADIVSDENYDVKIKVSGDEFTIPAQEQFSDCDPRYYKIGDLEFFLVCLTYHEFGGPYTKRYGFVQKTASGSIFESDVEFTGDSSYLKFPSLINPEGGSLHVSTSFRLLRIDTKTIIKEQ